MKKILFFLIAITYVLVSCDSSLEDSFLDQQTTKKERNGKDCIFENQEKKYSVFFPDVYSIHLNAINSSCYFNILVIPSWNDYENIIDKLDDLVETYNNDFDNQTSLITDEDALSDYADNIGFDEDAPLTKFEAELKFCSLRKKLLNSETQWLSQQGDGDWNGDNDPDNHFIDDDTERSLLSENSEVIIGTCESGYKYYKFYEWGVIGIDITSMDNVNQLISSLNNLGENPTQEAVISFANSILTKENVIVLADNNNNASESICRKKSGRFQDYHKLSKKHRMKKVWKVKNYALVIGTGGDTNGDGYTDSNGLFTLLNPKIKAKTKAYRKKAGIWMRARHTVEARIIGQVGGCSDAVMSINEHKRRKSKAKVKIKYSKVYGSVNNGNNFEFRQDKLRSEHQMINYDWDIHYINP